MKKTILSLLLIAVLLMSCMFLLSSCGSKEAPAAEAPAAEVEVPAAPAVAPAAEAPAAPAPAQEAAPAEDSVSVVGTWVYSWDSAIGSEESLTFTFNADGTCKMECSNGIGPWEGTYENDGVNVHVVSLNDGNDNPNVVPSMWAKWFVLETGESDLIVNPGTGTFTFVEIEGVELPSMDPSMEPSGEPAE